MQPTQVTPELVTAAAGSCDSTAADIDAELIRLKQYVMDLQTSWRGIASDQFNQLMHDFDVYGRMLHNSLNDIGSGLRGNAVNYVETELQNINNLVAVNGDIPGARL